MFAFNCEEASHIRPVIVRDFFRDLGSKVAQRDEQVHRNIALAFLFPSADPSITDRVLGALDGSIGPRAVLLLWRFGVLMMPITVAGHGARFAHTLFDPAAERRYDFVVGQANRTRRHGQALFDDIAVDCPGADELAKGKRAAV